MDMIGGAADAVAFTIGIAGNGGEICVQGRSGRHTKQGCAIFGTEDYMDEKK